MEEELPNTNPAAPPAADLSVLLITLLKGVLYRDADERRWAALLNLQARVRDSVAVLNLELVLDEAEGYAFLKSRPTTIRPRVCLAWWRAGRCPSP